METLQFSVPLQVTCMCANPHKEYLTLHHHVTVLYFFTLWSAFKVLNMSLGPHTGFYLMFACW